MIFAIVTLQIYRELEDTSTHRVVYHSSSVLGPLHGIPVNAQYQPLGVLDRRRLLARKSNTTYCYDFPLVSTSKPKFCGTAAIFPDIGFL